MFTVERVRATLRRERLRERAGHDAEAVGGGRGEERAVELQREAIVDAQQHLAGEFTKRPAMLVEPHLELHGALLLPAGRERVPEITAQLRRHLDVVRHCEHDEPGERLQRGVPRARLPLGPLLAQPPPRPLVHRPIGDRRQPRLGLAGTQVEPLPCFHRAQQVHAVAIGLTARAERLAPLAAFERPSNDPRTPRSCLRSTILDAEDVDLLHGTHRASTSVTS